MNNTIISVNDVSVSFAQTQALSHVSFTIKAGEVVALLGENGAGKSTLINCILGRLKVDNGDIKVFGVDPGEQMAKQQTGTILQSASLPDNTTVIEQIRLFSSYYPNPVAEQELIATAMLQGLEKRRLNTLSGGQKQRLFFALAICGNPKIIYLDEPTVGLDSSARREFWQCIETLKSQGVAIVLTTHYLEEAEALADEIVLLKQGQVIHQGTPSEVKLKALGKRVSFSSTVPCHQIKTLLATLNKQQPELLFYDTKFKNNQVTLTTATPEPLLALLFSNQISISDLTIESVRLEDAVQILNDNSQQAEKAA